MLKVLFLQNFTGSRVVWEKCMDHDRVVAARAKVQIPYECKGNLLTEIARPYLECLMLPHLRNRQTKRGIASPKLQTESK